MDEVRQIRMYMSDLVFVSEIYSLTSSVDKSEWL